MKNSISLVKKVLHASAIATALITALAGCGGDGSDSMTGSAVVKQIASNTNSDGPVVSLNASYRGQTYQQWVVSFWQWALAIPLPPANPYPHPFQDSKDVTLLITMGS